MGGGEERRTDKKTKKNNYNSPLSPSILSLLLSLPLDTPLSSRDPINNKKQTNRKRKKNKIKQTKYEEMKKRYIPYTACIHRLLMILTEERK